MSTGDWHKDYETRTITAYISAYNVTRQYGGPEEGGWYYDSYEFLKVSIPFRAYQDYRWEQVASDDDQDEMYLDPSKAESRWVTYGPPRPVDEAQLANYRQLLVDTFGDETRTRSSVLSHGDVEFIIERSPGERGEWPRPRYE